MEALPATLMCGQSRSTSSCTHRLRSTDDKHTHGGSWWPSSRRAAAGSRSAKALFHVSRERTRSVAECQ